MSRMESFSNSVPALALGELPKNLHYTCMSQSPVPFENPSQDPNSFSSPSFTTGPSPPFGGPERFQMDEGRSFTPSPCMQFRQPSPYPLVGGGDSVMLGRDWSGLYTEGQTYGSNPWNSEPVCIPQGGPIQYGNTGTVHHYGAPQNFQSLQRNSCRQYGGHFLGDIDQLCEIDCARDVHGTLEQDCQVTSSTEVSPLCHMSEMLNNVCDSPFNWQCDRPSVIDGRRGGSQMNQHTTALNASSLDVPKRKTVAETQTPWKLKKHKRHLSLQKAARTNEEVQKIDQKSQTRNTQNYDRQKAVQRKREHAIKDEVCKLYALLPRKRRDKPPSRNEILHNAISYIGTLEYKVGKICQEMGTVRPTCKVDIKDRELSCKTTTELAKLKEKDGKEFPETKEEFGGVSEPMVTELDCLRSILNSHTNIQDSKFLAQKKQGETTAHVKRPMNAFLIFSKEHRKKYQDKYPGRDNRRITTLMAEDWNKMEDAKKKPYKDEADELMRKKKENPMFKYIQARKIPQTVVCSTEKNSSGGFRVGNHILRARKVKGTVDIKSARCVKVEGLARDSAAGKIIQEGTCLVQKTSNMSNAKGREQLLSVPEGEPQGTLQVHKDKVLETGSWIKDTQQRKEATGRKGHDNWAQCDVCHKWRKLSDHVDLANLPDKWFCWFSSDDACNDCSFPENYVHIRSANPGC